MKNRCFGEMKRIAIFVKPTDVRVELLDRLVKIIEGTGREVLLERRAAELLQGRCPKIGYERKELGSLCDVAVVLGGDGTMLGVARAIAEYGRPIIGVNAGRLGFITDVAPDNMDRVIPAMLDGECTSDRRYLLEGSVFRNGESVFTSLAGNDIGFSHGRAGGMIDVAVCVDGKPMCCQSADGIICSTAMGSTAYALAAGGPILHPAVDALLLVPVAPHTVSNRPIVLSTAASIDIRLTRARDAVAYFDMQEFFDVVPGDVLKIRNSKLTIEILHPHNYDYFGLLQKKLNWNSQ